MGSINFTTGTLRGKLGNLVGSPQWGRQVVRSVPVITQQPTALQTLHRSRVKRLAGLVQTYGRTPGVMDLYRYGGGLSLMSILTRMNKGNFESDFDDLADLHLSQGVLSTVASHAVVLVFEGIIEVTEFVRAIDKKNTVLDMLSVILYVQNPFEYLRSSSFNVEAGKLFIPVPEVNPGVLGAALFYRNRSGEFSDVYRIPFNINVPVGRAEFKRLLRVARGLGAPGRMYGDTEEETVIDGVINIVGGVLNSGPTDHHQDFGNNNGVAGWFTKASYNSALSAYGIQFDFTSLIYLDAFLWDMTIGLYTEDGTELLGFDYQFNAADNVFVVPSANLQQRVWIAGTFFTKDNGFFVLPHRAALLDVEVV